MRVCSQIFEKTKSILTILFNNYIVICNEHELFNGCTYNKFIIGTGSMFGFYASTILENKTTVRYE